MKTTTTRRGLLKAAPGAAAALAIPGTAAIAATPNRDAGIEAAWEGMISARARLDVIFRNGDTPEEQRLIATRDAAEETIQSTVATTLRGVMIQLWTALGHNITTRDEDAACARGDLSFFNEERERAQDWDARLMLAALRSLDAMGA